MSWFRSFFRKLKDGLNNKSSRDPVCGMRATDGIVLVYEGLTYSFCSEHCQQQFGKNPQAYIKKQ